MIRSIFSSSTFTYASALRRTTTATSSSSFNTLSGQYKYSTSSPKNRHLRIALVGAPGSGKGTQSAKLERDYGLIPLSTGHILRQAAQEDSQLGKEIKATLESGKLVSDDYMFKVIKEFLTKMKNGYLLDGYPRTTKQAEAMDSWLEQHNKPLDFVLYLEVPEDVLMERIQDRWIHPASGRAYNSTYNAPRVPGQDDITGEPLIKRADDNDVKYKERIDTYHRETMPIIEHYRSKGKLLTIHSPNSDVGYEVIKNIFDSYE